MLQSPAVCLMPDGALDQAVLTTVHLWLLFTSREACRPGQHLSILRPTSTISLELQLRLGSLSALILSRV